MNLRDRIRKVVERWFLAEPLLFAAWSTHRVEPSARTETLRIAHGRVEYAPAFLAALDDRTLRSVLTAEALRILLQHPYLRRRPSTDAAWLASNLTLAECLGDPLLPFPRAADLFGTHEHDRAWFERYYDLLTSGAAKASLGQGTGAAAAGEKPSGGRGEPDGDDGESDGDDGDDGESDGDDGESDGDDGGGSGDGEEDPSPLERHAAASDNAREWDGDEFVRERLQDAIRTAESSRTWGTIAGHLREQILATLRVRVDYRTILRQFRMSVLSQTRLRTRMKPSRRYGFEQLGSRRDFTTRLLVAVDVSGSMSSDDLQAGFSIINRFFRYGVEAVDVIQFDTEIQGPAETLRKARHNVTVRGRGGTDFTPVVEWVDAHPRYDGLIVFTDGVAAVPPRPRVVPSVWLFTHEQAWELMHKGLERVGKTAFVRSD